jgi:Ca-activated chloride channel family protein
VNLFANPTFLFTSPFILGALLLVYFVSRKVVRSRTKQLVASKLLTSVVPYYSLKREIIKIALFFVGIVTLLISWSGPQWGYSQQEKTQTSLDILIAIDVSKSMLSKDIKPNRLTRVINTLNDQIIKVDRDRLGIIKFSNNVKVLCPLTLNHLSFKEHLNRLSVKPNFGMGTDIGKAIQYAEKVFEKDDKDQFLILITDGGDLEGKARMSAKKAAKKGIKIFTIGVGSDDGNLDDGLPVGVDVKLLKNISESTGGQFVRLGPNGEGIEHIFTELQSIGQKKLREQRTTSLPINRYQFFAAFSLFLFLIEPLTPSGKKRC